jgi:hypothetical protein
MRRAFTNSWQTNDIDLPLSVGTTTTSGTITPPTHEEEERDRYYSDREREWDSKREQDRYRAEHARTTSRGGGSYVLKEGQVLCYLSGWKLWPGNSTYSLVLTRHGLRMVDDETHAVKLDIPASNILSVSGVEREPHQFVVKVRSSILGQYVHAWEVPTERECIEWVDALRDMVHAYSTQITDDVEWPHHVAGLGDTAVASVRGVVSSISSSLHSVKEMASVHKTDDLQYDDMDFGLRHLSIHSPSSSAYSSSYPSHVYGPHGIAVEREEELEPVNVANPHKNSHERYGRRDPESSFDRRRDDRSWERERDRERDRDRDRDRERRREYERDDQSNSQRETGRTPQTQETTTLRLPKIVSTPPARRERAATAPALQRSQTRPRPQPQAQAQTQTQTQSQPQAQARPQGQSQSQPSQAHPQQGSNQKEWAPFEAAFGPLLPKGVAASAQLTSATLTPSASPSHASSMAMPATYPGHSSVAGVATTTTGLPTYSTGVPLTGMSTASQPSFASSSGVLYGSGGSYPTATTAATVQYQATPATMATTIQTPQVVQQGGVSYMYATVLSATGQPTVALVPVMSGQTPVAAGLGQMQSMTPTTPSPYMTFASTTLAQSQLPPKNPRTSQGY